MKSLLFFAVLLGFSFFVSTGYACCSHIPLEERFQNTPVIFLGTVHTIKHDDPDNPPYVVTFNVLKSWKGNAKNGIEINASTGRTKLPNGTTVEISARLNKFEEGKEYIVFANSMKESPEKLYAGACSFTQEFRGNKILADQLDQLSAKK